MQGASVGSPPGTVYAQAFVKPDGKRRLLLVNKRDCPASVVVAGAGGGRVDFVDQKTGFGPPGSARLASDAGVAPNGGDPGRDPGSRRVLPGRLRRPGRLPGGGARRRRAHLGGLRPRGVYHGKVGRGLSVEMSVKHGPITVLSVVETGDRRLELLVAEGESVPGPIVEIGNTSRYRFPIGARIYVNEWSRHGPAHHCAVGVGHVAAKVEKLGRLLGMHVSRVC